MPIISLFRPFKIMQELYEELLGILYKKDIYTNISSQFLGWWWFLWILNGIIGQMSFRYSLRAESLNELMNSTISEMAGNILGIPLAIITVKVIKDASKLEKEVDLASEIIITEEIPKEIITTEISNEL